MSQRGIEASQFLVNNYLKVMQQFTRITLDPEIMGGKPCIRGMRVTVDAVVGLVSAGYSAERILEAYPYLEADDIKEVLTFASLQGVNSKPSI